MQHLRRFVWLGVLLGLFSLVAAAQSTGQIIGTVVDSTGAVIPNANLTISSSLLGVNRQIVSDSSGNFAVPQLRVGLYQLDATAKGFAASHIASITVQVSQTTTLKVVLGVASSKETVTVSGVAPVIDSSSVAAGDVVTQKQIQQIPLNGRHFVDLGQLVPGSVVAPQNGFLTAPLRGQGALAFDTAGNREDTTNFLINGVNLNDMSQNQITFQPSIDTVAEFKVVNSTPDAQQGRNSGAVVDIATRSGTNDVHGELFEFIRNDVLDARNFFASTKNPFKRNDYGVSVGGPIVHNKLFYFGSYEGLRQRQGLPVNTLVLNSAQRTAVTDPVSQKLLDLIPQANDSTGSRYVGAATAPVNIDQGTGDIQYILGAADTLHAYYAFQRDYRQEPTLQGNNVPGFGDTRVGHRQVFTFNEDHVFSSSTINSFRLGANRIHITFVPNTTLTAAAYGITAVSSSTLLPFLQLSGGGFGIGGPSGFPQGRGDTAFVLADTVSHLSGSHYFQMGFEARRVLSNNFSDTPGYGVFTSIANFQQGLLSFFSTTQGANNSNISTDSYGGFFQDTWKLKPNFTVVAGIRYDYNTTPVDGGGRYVIFDPATGSLTGTKTPYQANGKQIQPRVGINWDPFGDGKTAVRAGYGIYFDQPVLNSVGGLTGNPPNATPILAVSSSTNPVYIDNPSGKTGTISPSTIAPDFQGDYVQNWNLNIQRQLTSSLGISAGYYGNKGTDLRLAVNQNQGKLYPAYGAITEVISSGNSSYNGLWVSAKQQFSHDLEFDTNFNWSKSIDENSLNSRGSPCRTATTSVAIAA